MKRVDDILDNELRPFIAIVGYSNERDNYFETHTIDKGNDGYTMGAGVPLTVECMSELAYNFRADFTTTPHGKIPKTLLYFNNLIGQQKYVWYNPPQKRMMFFTKDLNIENGEYYVPGIVYLADNENLQVFSFKGRKPVDKLYQAPFFNVTDGKVCLGNAKIPYPDNPTYDDFLKYWEDKFWLTEFSHLGSNPVKGNLVLVTKEMKKSFNQEVLLPTKITLNKLFES